MFDESGRVDPRSRSASSQADEQMDQWLLVERMHRQMNTWWGRSMVCLSADHFAENLLEGNGADVKQSKLEGRNGLLTWKWTLEYLDHL